MITTIATFLRRGHAARAYLAALLRDEAESERQERLANLAGQLAESDHG